jgi:hypothetical protein
VHPNPFGLAYSLSPVDLPEPLLPEPHPLKWVSTVIGTATLVLLLFNAHALRGWAYQLQPGFWSEQAVAAAETWYGLVDGAGLNRPFGTMHGFWQAAREEAQPSPADSSTRSARANSSSASG